MTCAPAYVRCRSLTHGVDAAEVRLVQHDRHVERAPQPPTSGSKIGSSTVRPAIRLGRMTPPTNPCCSTQRSSSATASAGSCCGSSATPTSRDGSVAQYPREPVVVGRAQRSRGLRVLVQPVHQPEAREQHRGVDALLVEHPQPLDRVAAAGALDAAGRDMRLRPSRQPERRPPRLALDQVDDAAVGVAFEARREVAQRRIDVLDDPSEVFLDVAVGVDDGHVSPEAAPPDPIGVRLTGVRSAAMPSLRSVTALS